MSNPDQIFRVGPLAKTNGIFNVQPDTIPQVSSQEPPTSFKPPSCNQKLILSRSLAELSLFTIYLSHNSYRARQNILITGL